jgi:hypothetical protein
VRHARGVLIGAAALALGGAGAAISVQGALWGGGPPPSQTVSVVSLDGTTTRNLDLFDGVGASVDLAHLRFAAEVEGRVYLVGPGREADTVCTVSVEPDAQVVGCDSTAAYRDRRGTLLMYQREDATRSGVLILPRESTRRRWRSMDGGTPRATARSSSTSRPPRRRSGSAAAASPG